MATTIVIENQCGQMWTKPKQKGLQYFRCNPLNLHGAGGRNRTDMDLRPRDFESSANTTITYCFDNTYIIAKINLFHFCSIFAEIESASIILLP